MKSRRGNKAENTREIICAGFGAETPENLLFDPCAANRRDWKLRCSFSGIVGIGNTPVPGKSQDVILEVAETLQQTPASAFVLENRYAKSGCVQCSPSIPKASSAYNGCCFIASSITLDVFAAIPNWPVARIPWQYSRNRSVNMR